MQNRTLQKSHHLSLSPSYINPTHSLSLHNTSNQSIINTITKIQSFSSINTKWVTKIFSLISLLALAMAVTIIPLETQALVPYSKSRLWDMMMLPTDDPFRILEQVPIAFPKGVESLPLARADWKETTRAHVISIDMPGIKKADVSIEVEENRVLRVSGEIKGEEEAEEIEGDKWHRAERISGKFLRQFRLPANADLEKVEAHLENGVLRIAVPKLPEEKKKEPKVINIAGGNGASAEAIKAEL